MRRMAMGGGVILLLAGLPAEAQRRTYDRFSDSTTWQAGGHTVDGGGTNAAALLGLASGSVRWEVRAFGWAAGDARAPAAVTLQITRLYQVNAATLRQQPSMGDAPETVELALIVDSLRFRLVSRPRIPARRTVEQVTRDTWVTDVYHLEVTPALAEALRGARRVEGRLANAAEFEWWATERSYREMQTLLDALPRAP